MQVTLFCACGSTKLWAKGRCRRCYDSHRASRSRFGGKRDQTIARDGGRCTNCGSVDVVVHHRRANALITLCPVCHAKVHRTLRIRFGRFSIYLLGLWRERHPGWPEQLCLPGFMEPQPEPEVAQAGLFEQS